jgi:uncharacterized protein (DUF885 family)
LPAIADTALRTMLDRDPVNATYLGDHERDGLLPDPSREAAQARVRQLRTLLAELDALPADTAVDRAVDAAVLRTVLTADLFDLEELREAEWNPMLYNPGGGLHALLSREFAPLPDRLASLAERLAAVPEYLHGARSRLGEMPRIHVETARAQLTGTVALVDAARSAAAEHAPELQAAIDCAAESATEALTEHRRWLGERQETARRDPRIGPQLFHGRLALTLDTAFDPESLLARALASLEDIEAEIADAASRLTGRTADPETVRHALDELAHDAPDDATILGECAAALAETTAFVRSQALVTVFDDSVNVVEMPEIDRGVAVAYCRPNGPLETADIPTDVAVSPTPADWPAEQVASFYREYNLHMLQDLTVHEAMPGHALQLMHSNRHRADTPIRRVWPSGSFVEGWAVYAEELMADHDYRGAVSPHAAAALRMQQLKMQLRMTINAILDIRFHCDDLDEAAAHDLMRRRGFQEQGEADGKWRRVQLTSTQLCTYYVGYLETSRIAADLRVAHPDWPERRRHDAMLAHGSPPPRHLRTLLGLDAHG